MHRALTRRARHFLAATGAITVLVTAATATIAESEGWPREIVGAQGKVTLYQPQVESFEGDTLESRAAVSVTLADATEPVFGAVWMTARVSTDRDERTVTVLDIKVPRVRFPGASEEHQQELSAFLEREIPKWNLVISLDRLLTSLELAERKAEMSEGLNMDPPAIRYVSSPTVLVTLDGDPELQEVDDSKSLMRVANTPFTIALDTQKKKYYLDGGATWYSADDVMGPYEVTANPPQEVAALRPPEAVEEIAAIEQDNPGDEKAEPPAIIVVTAPTELIVSDGDPKYSPISGTDLLYMSNTESAVIMDIESQQYYLVLSGRWFASKSLKNGPWAWVPADELPEDFAEIPVDSDVGGVRTFVAGTEEAKDAVLDNSIPQTSAVKRTETLTVTYDGEPKFEPIEDTEMKFAVNTSYSVIQVENRYYVCHEAVWFVSGSPLGPWVVADEIPSAIYTIPPDSPVYNTRYVYVYESTPEVVYVGYTPGYTGSYVYHTTVVYGTGWYYPGWYGRYYYPRPRTWGFSVRYNPWYGWSFGLSWSNGPFTFSIGYGGYGGWWGPRGYGYGYHRGYRHGYHHGYRAGYHAGQRQAHRDNLYNRPDNRKRNADRPATSNRPSAGTAAGKPNNVYTDKNGNVYRRDDDGWQKREGNDWKKTDGVPGAGDQAVRPSDRPSTAEQRPSTGDARPSTGKQDRPSSSPGSGAAAKPSTGSTRPSTSQGASGLERDYQARQQGTSRTNNYNHSRSASPSRGSRGGGGRRR